MKNLSANGTPLTDLGPTSQVDLPNIELNIGQTQREKPKEMSSADAFKGLMQEAEMKAARNLQGTQFAKGSELYKDTGFFGVKTAYEDIGYNPLFDNEDRLSKRGGWDKFTDVMTGMGMVALGTIVNNNAQKGNIVSSIAKGDFTFEDVIGSKVAQEISDNNEAIMDVYRTGTRAGAEPKDGFDVIKGFVNIFDIETMANSWGTLGMNLGFTVGTMADIMAENALFAAATGAETGGVGVVAAGARAGVGLTRALYRGLAMTYKAVKGLDNVTDAGRAAYRAMELANPALKTMKVVGNVAKQMGRSAYISAGEASLEAAGSAKQFQDEMLKRYRDENGADPTTDQKFMDDLKKSIKDTKTEVFGSNMVILTASNALTFSNLLSGKSLMKASNLTEAAKRLVKGPGGVIRTAKQAAKEGGLLGVAKRYGINTGKAIGDSWNEAAEEVLQGVANESARRRHDLFDKDNSGVLASFGNTLSDRAGSVEFYEEAVSGLMTGLVMKGGGKMLNWRGDAKNEELAQGLAGMLNTAMKNAEINKTNLDDMTTPRSQGGMRGGKKFQDRPSTHHIYNTANQANAMALQSVAVNENNAKEFHDAKHQAVVSFLQLNATTGRSEFALDSMRDQLDTLTEAEFAEKMNIPIEEVSSKRQSMSDEFMKDLTEKQNRFDETYAQILNKYKNPYNSEKEPEKYRAYQEAQLHVSTYEQDWGNALLRTGQLTKDIATHIEKNYGAKVEEQDIHVINDNVLLEERISILKDLVRAQAQNEDVMTPMEKKDYENNQRKLALLEAVKNEKNDEGQYQEAANAYISYLVRQKQNVSQADISQDLIDLADARKRMREANTPSEKALAQKDLDSARSRINSKKIIAFGDQDLHMLIRDMSDLEGEQRYFQDMFNILRGDGKLFESFVNKIVEANRSVSEQADKEELSRPDEKSADTLPLIEELQKLFPNFSNDMLEDIANRVSVYINENFVNDKGVFTKNETGKTYPSLSELLKQERGSITEILKRDAEKQKEKEVDTLIDNTANKLIDEKVEEIVTEAEDKEVQLLGSEPAEKVSGTAQEEIKIEDDNQKIRKISNEIKKIEKLIIQANDGVDEDVAEFAKDNNDDILSYRTIDFNGGKAIVYDTNQNDGWSGKGSSFRKTWDVLKFNQSFSNMSSPAHVRILMTSEQKYNYSENKKSEFAKQLRELAKSVRDTNEVRLIDIRPTSNVNIELLNNRLSELKSELQVLESKQTTLPTTEESKQEGLPINETNDDTNVDTNVVSSPEEKSAAPLPTYEKITTKEVVNPSPITEENKNEIIAKIKNVATNVTDEEISIGMSSIESIANERMRRDSLTFEEFLNGEELSVLIGRMFNVRSSADDVQIVGSSPVENLSENAQEEAMPNEEKSTAPLPKSLKEINEKDTIILKEDNSPYIVVSKDDKKGTIRVRSLSNPNLYMEVEGVDEISEYRPSALELSDEEFFKALKDSDRVDEGSCEI